MAGLERITIDEVEDIQVFQSEDGLTLVDGSTVEAFTIPQSDSEQILVSLTDAEAITVQIAEVMVGGAAVGVTDPLLLNDGAVASPTYSFTLSPTTGAWSSAAGVYNISADGVKLAEFASTYIRLYKDTRVYGSVQTPEVDALGSPTLSMSVNGVTMAQYTKAVVFEFGVFLDVEYIRLDRAVNFAGFAYGSLPFLPPANAFHTIGTGTYTYDDTDGALRYIRDSSWILAGSSSPVYYAGTPYNFTARNGGQMVQKSADIAATWTIPLSISGVPLGGWIEVANTFASSITIARAAGVVLYVNGVDKNAVLSGPGGYARLRRLTSTVWVAEGSLLT